MIKDNKMTLLVVDDEVINIPMLLETLGKEYTVRVVTDGAAALLSVKKSRPDLILLDVMMPGMDGFEVCRRILDDPTTRDIPIIFLTARSEDADEARGLALGAVDYITKPFNTAIVKTRVRNHLELKKRQDHLVALETQSRQLQKAESLRRMAGAIAHIFNNQLGVVIGNLDMALEGLPPGSDAVESLTIAMRAAWEAAAVSGQMLTYLGQSFDKHEPTDLAELCRRTLPVIKATMPGTVVLESALPSCGPVLMANENELQQVLTNLITNAWEAVAEGRGAIHLEVKKVFPVDISAGRRYPIDWQPGDKAYACLEVKDTGSGIADKDIEKLFDPFFSSKFTGRGMGLAMVLGIVKAHHGAITVESEPGMGSTFRVFLPVSAEELPQQTNAAPRA